MFKLHNRSISTQAQHFILPTKGAILYKRNIQQQDATLDLYFTFLESASAHTTLLPQYAKKRTREPRYTAKLSSSKKLHSHPAAAMLTRLPNRKFPWPSPCTETEKNGLAHSYAVTLGALGSRPRVSVGRRMRHAHAAGPNLYVTQIFRKGPCVIRTNRRQPYETGPPFSPFLFFFFFCSFIIRPRLVAILLNRVNLSREVCLRAFCLES